MFPSKHLTVAFLLPGALSIATVFVSDLLVPVLLLDLALLIFAGIDYALTRSSRIEAKVVGRDILSIGQGNQVQLYLTLRGRAALKIEVRPDLPAEINCPELRQDSTLKALLVQNRTAEIRYHLVPERRGKYTLGRHYVRYPSRFYLWTKQEVLTEGRDVQVYPDLAMIRAYELLARQHRQYALVRASRLRGGESEFARLRDYTNDDDYRFIDWKATARRNQLTTREFQLESDQNVFLMLDAGRLMTGAVAGLSQFDLALNSALLMAHVASRGGDRVGLMCFDDNIRAFLSPQGGPKATGRLVRATYDLHPGLTDSAFQKALGTFDSRIKQRCLLMIFTQLLDNNAAHELTTQLGRIAKKHLPVVIILEDTELSDIARAPRDGADTLRELFDRGAAAELLRWKAEAIATLKKNGALVIETPAAQLNNKVINRYLTIKAQHAL
jgi:uncharacterized protein (DUF58 family)